MSNSAWMLRISAILLLIYFLIYYFLFTQLATFLGTPFDSPATNEEKIKLIIQMSFFRIVGIPVFLMIIEYFILSFLLNRNLNLILKINNIFIIVLIIDGITFVVGKVILYNLNYPTMYQIDIITIINMIILLSFMLLFSIFIKKMQDKMDRRIAI